VYFDASKFKDNITLGGLKSIMFLAYGKKISHQPPVLENVILHPHERRVACDDVTISRALLMYKIAFILMGSGLKQ